MTPAHQHDCSRCLFVGIDTALVGEPETNQVDLYTCQSSLIRRFSSRPDDYYSWDRRMEPIPERYKTILNLLTARET